MKVFQKLLGLSAGALILWSMFVPPIYPLWLMALGNYFLGAKSKAKTAFNVVAILHLVVYTGFFVLLASQFPGRPSPEVNLDAMFLAMASTWLVTAVWVAWAELQYDQRNKPEEYISKAQSIIQIFKGALLLMMYWPIGIAVYQPKVMREN